MYNYKILLTLIIGNSINLTVKHHRNWIVHFIFNDKKPVLGNIVGQIL